MDGASVRETRLCWGCRARSVVGLLDEGEIPSERLPRSRHGKVRLAGVLAFNARRERRGEGRRRVAERSQVAHSAAASDDVCRSFKSAADNVPDGGSRITRTRQRPAPPRNVPLCASPNHVPGCPSTPARRHRFAVLPARSTRPHGGARVPICATVRRIRFMLSGGYIARLWYILGRWRNI